MLQPHRGGVGLRRQRYWRHSRPTMFPHSTWEQGPRVSRKNGSLSAWKRRKSPGVCRLLGRNRKKFFTEFPKGRSWQKGKLKSSKYTGKYKNITYPEGKRQRQAQLSYAHPTRRTHRPPPRWDCRTEACPSWAHRGAADRRRPWRPCGWAAPCRVSNWEGRNGGESLCRAHNPHG